MSRTKQRTKHLRACQRKKNYTKKQATVAVKYLRTKEIYKKMYKCPICPYWHLSHAHRILKIYNTDTFELGGKYS
jgi:hypothetical protein